MKLIKGIAALLLCFMLVGTSVSAAPSYESYGYNAWGESVPSPDGYIAEESIYGSDIGTTPLNSAQDIYCSAEGLNFIADTGNNRILVCNSDWVLQKEISALSGGTDKFNAPEGVFYNGEYIFVADTGNKRLLKLNMEGDILTVFEKPTSTSFDEDVDFKPSKVAVDGTGTVYTLVDGLYRGAILFTEDGEFDGFFGSNNVEVTAEVLLNRFWQKFMTRTQRKKQQRNIPIEFTNLDIDEEGFLYTCTSPKVTSGNTGQLKKLNSSAKNIFVSDKDIAWASGQFGDIETAWVKGQQLSTDFVDVAVSDDDFVVAIDYTKGRVFEYSSSSELTFIFGGKSDGQLGTFVSPVAIDVSGEDICVLDASKNNITIFRLTEFGNLVHKAIILHNDGKYLEASELWQEISARDANFELAYLGLGKAYYQMKDYEKSMKYYELANDNIGRSQAFEDYRSVWLGKNLPIIFVAIGLLVIAAIAVRLILKKKGVRLSAAGSANIGSFLLHPISSTEEIKEKKTYSFIASVIIVALFFAANLAVYQFEGRNFNINKPDTLNVFLISLGTVLPFVLFVVANWSVTTLLEGKGNFMQILCFTAYSLIPYTAALWIAVPTSYSMSVNELALLSGVKLLGIIWSVILLFISLMTIHQYSFKKTIIALAITVFGMLVMAFLILMLFSLVQQIYVFGYTVYSELRFRA